MSVNSKFCLNSCFFLFLDNIFLCTNFGYENTDKLNIPARKIRKTRWNLNSLRPSIEKNIILSGGLNLFCVIPSPRGAEICSRCWPLMVIAMKIVDRALRGEYCRIRAGFPEDYLRLQGAHAGLTKSYKVLYFFFICKALQSLIFGVFPPRRSYKVLFLLENKFQNWELYGPNLELKLPNSIHHFANSQFLYLSRRTLKFVKTYVL